MRLLLFFSLLVIEESVAKIFGFYKEMDMSFSLVMGILMLMAWLGYLDYLAVKK